MIRRLIASAILISFGLSAQQVYSTDNIETITQKNIRIIGVKHGIHATISHTINNKSISLARCLTPCSETVESNDSLYITLSPPKKPYGAIRRDLRDAQIEEKNYTFDITLDTSENEEIRYVRSMIPRYFNDEKANACNSFQEEDLTEKAKACYKMTPSMPPHTVRSGWCKVAFTILPNGRVDKVEARECSEDLFKISSIETAKTYRYYPKFKDGKIQRSRLISTIRYSLSNGKGKIIPPKRKK